MKIEKISENQIKCTLTRSDLASRQIRLSELTYGTDKARGLFQDLMEQANLELGYDISEFPLMIEAIPVSMDCIVLMITKVDDPEEVDSRFSELANLNEMFAKDSSEDFDFSSLFGTASTSGLYELGKTIKSIASGNTSGEVIFSFSSLEAVISLAKSVSGYQLGENALYKSREDAKYYLKMKPLSGKHDDFTHITAIASEFGVNEASGYARAAYLEEHFDNILDTDALQSLAYV